MNESFWLWTFLGRMHPLLVHFPVALLLFAGLLELLSLKKFHSALRPAIAICLATGVITAAFAALFGWFLSSSGDYGPDTLLIHQWTGIATTLLGAIAYLLLRRGVRKNTITSFRLYRSVLFVSAIGVSVSGHFGASLTHGTDYLTSALPWSEGYGEQVQLSGIDFVSLENDTAVLDGTQQSALQVQVKSIFAHKCYKCHGPEKVKGDLRLDNKEMLFRGGESGPVIVPGNPEESEMYKRITLPHDHEDVMPSKGKKLQAKEIEAIKFWIQKGAPWPDEDEEKVFRTAALEPRNPLLPVTSANMGNPVDLWVNEYFKKNKVEWPAKVDDRIFLRRIYLDIIGLLPTPAELENFIRDPRPNKRALYVRQLLNRNDDYAVHWLSFWNDALRNDYTGTGYITDGRSAITGWLYTSLQKNKPYNQFMQELINPSKESEGFIEGIRWRGVVNASQRTEIQAAQNVAQVFLGLNLKCASCHNSFINNWKLEDAYAFANIFSDSSLEINRCDKPTGKFTKAKMLWEQLGEIDNEASKTEKQKQLAAIITKPENGRVYRTIVNRIWSKMMGRGIVEPVDVMDNEPWSQDLLDWVAYQFANEGKYDLKELIYLIATSDTYQLVSKGYNDVNKLTAENYQFTGMVRRRMSAEQFADAVGKIVAPVFSDSMMMYNPGDSKAAFLNETTGPRASLVVNNVFLTALGRPNRETVTTSRESEANLLQALELTNGAQFNSVLKKGAARWLSKYNEPAELTKQIYRHGLGRNPTEGELNVALNLFGNQVNTEQVEDLLWSLMLLPEFQLIY